MFDGRVTVVVATCNRRADLLRTLPEHEAPVIVVDNGSTDGTAEAVRQCRPDVDFIALGHNVGAVARNVGVSRAGSPYVAFADDDSYWEPGSLDKAATLLDQHERAALLCGRVLVGTDARLDPTSVEMAAAPLGWAPDLPGPIILGFLACAAIVRREAFLQVGGFAPMLHVYGEEQLLAWDLSAAGWGLAYVEDIVARHLPSRSRVSRSERRRREVRNRLLTAWLRRPPARAVAVTAHALRRAISDPDEGAGALAAAARLPTVLRHRRRIPDQLEHSIRMLELRSASWTSG
ncbi:MAG: glycosyltransferase [Jiangellaceae bacterium]|nr:glycosyltransferase [Jiangellaceae bacterium]